MLSFGSWLSIIAAVLLALGAVVELVARINDMRPPEGPTAEGAANSQLAGRNTVQPQSESPFVDEESTADPLILASAANNPVTLKEANQAYERNQSNTDYLDEPIINAIFELKERSSVETTSKMAGAPLTCVGHSRRGARPELPADLEMPP